MGSNLLMRSESPLPPKNHDDDDDDDSDDDDSDDDDDDVSQPLPYLPC